LTLKKFIQHQLKALKSFRAFKNLHPKSRKIIFYAEDIQSQNYLYDIAKELLINLNQEICYLTSDPDDTIFKEEKKYANLHTYYIGSGLLRTWIFASLEADLMIMTTPDLETFQLKRSKTYNVHYLYIFHALVSTHSVYRLGAFDAYDTIFCTGKQQMAEIRKTETYYNLNKKNLYRDGYRPLEYLMDESKNFAKVNSEKLHILIAPSWGSNNLFEHCIEKLLDSLLESADMEVTLRPHPMTIRHKSKQLQQLREIYKNHLNFHIQTNIDNRDILFRSDILITDWSGIGMEYGLGLQKPVIYIDVPKKNNNPEFHKINLIPVEVGIRAEIGEILEIDKLENINQHILKILRKYNKHEILEVRKKYVFMRRNSLHKSAKRILSIANSNRSRNLKNHNEL
jgi:YidC/Oxa1 family membrane protein insertase